MSIYTSGITFVLLSLVFVSHGSDPGPAVKATKGFVWPKPQQQIFKDEYLSIDARSFKFIEVNNSCEILKQAINWYQPILGRIRRMAIKLNEALNITTPVLESDTNFRGQLPSLQIDLQMPCEDHPHLNMDEKYELIVNSDAKIFSKSIWGVLRGLETFSQLIYTEEGSRMLLLNQTHILDFPRFPHRGLLLDTSRHFLPTRIIHQVLDGMAMNKLNVLHWHIVDDQSFPFVSKSYPELSNKGAFSPLHVYSPQDVQSIINVALIKGIRVIPEFDSPGHTRSWGIAHPEILTECYDKNGTPDGSLGPMNPISKLAYNFMNGLLQEISTVFPDEFVHLGGDEVPFQCWESNPQIKQYMKEGGLTIKQLEGEYILQIVNRTKDIGLSPLVWQEVFDNGVQIPLSTIVHVWKGWTEYKDMMDKVTKAGFSTILSSCWYLDYLNTGGDWKRFYDCDASNFLKTEKQRKLVLGGEACMWGESVDATNIMTRIWPRASAAAEKLWSAELTDSIAVVEERLEEHTCRMNLRGVPSQPPNGPGFCPFQFY